MIKCKNCHGTMKFTNVLMDATGNKIIGAVSSCVDGDPTCGESRHIVHEAAVRWAIKNADKVDSVYSTR